MVGDIYVGNNDINGLLFCAALLLPSAPSGLCLSALDCSPCRASTLAPAFLPFTTGQIAARTRQSGALESDHTLMDALHKCQVTSVAGLAGALGSASALPGALGDKKLVEDLTVQEPSRCHARDAPRRLRQRRRQACGCARWTRLGGQGTGACVGCSATGAA